MTSPSEPRTDQELYHGDAETPEPSTTPPGSGGGEPPSVPITPARAWGLLAVGVGIIYAVQITSVAVGLSGLAASTLGDLACIAFFVLYGRRHKFGLRGFGVTRVRPRWFVVATLVGVSAWYLNLVIVSLLHVPEGDESMLKDVLEQAPVPIVVVLIALLPAIAEELVFRGALARGIATKKSRRFAVLVSSGVFGMYHVLPAQMVATFLLGCLLGWFALRARSIVPSMLVHFLNNTMAVLISRNAIPGVESTLDAHPVAGFELALLLTAAGVALALREVG